MKLDARIPSGPLADKWQLLRDEIKLVSPANKRKHSVIVVGTGLAGGSAAASLGELGYRVKAFCYQDSARRAHSIAAQGGINAAKNYQNDGDTVFRLFCDTVTGGDFRAREANVYRLAELSMAIIDQAVAQGVPFAREYGGQLANRSFGGAQVSRTFYARGQTGQQLLLGCYQALSRQIARGKPDAAGRALRRAVELEPASAVNRALLAACLARVGDLEQASEHFEVARISGRAPELVREIEERLPPGTQWAYTTIRTMLTRLVEKGAVSEHKRSNLSFYKPTLTKRKARMAALSSVVNDAFEGAFGPLMHFLVEDQGLSAKQRQELIKALQKKHKRKGTQE